MARVVIENLSKVFAGARGEEIWAVRNASLTVEDKEFLVLVGPSGCGKTTTLRMIAGLEDVSEGTISIDGQLMNTVPPKDRDIAMVFQNYALYPHMTVFENMAFGLKLRKFPKAEIERRVGEAAEILGLAGYLDRKPRALSGGERQRVALGRAIVRKPKVFLFDEPLSNLDVPLRAQMRLEMTRLHARLGATLIYVTHDQAEAMTMGDRMAVMQQGVIQQVAEPIALYNSPVNRFVAGFIGSPPMNFFTGTILQEGSELLFAEEGGAGEGGRANFVVCVDKAQSAQVSGYVGKMLILGLRPEHLWLNSHDACATKTATLSAKVELVEPMGAETHVYLRSGAHSFVARMPGGQRVEVNQTVALTFDMGKGHFFDPIDGVRIASAA